MRPLRRFPIDDVSQVGEARRAAQALATELGFDADASGRLALVVTELGTNLVRHVGPGRHAELLVGPDVARGPAAPAVQVLSMDRGDGMDLERCLRDGYSTGGSSGTGLGAIRRMANGFDIHSTPEGTVCLVRVSGTGRTVPARRWGAASIAAPGETVCGDAWAVAVDENQLAAALGDEHAREAPLGRVLMAKGWLDEETLAEAIAFQSDLPRAALDRERGGRHHLADLAIQRGRPFRAQPVDHVAFGEDSKDTPALNHGHRTDTPFREQLHDRAHRHVWIDGDHLPVPRLENRSDRHAGLLFLGRAGPLRPG